MLGKGKTVSLHSQEAGITLPFDIYAWDPPLGVENCTKLQSAVQHYPAILDMLYLFVGPEDSAKAAGDDIPCSGLPPLSQRFPQLPFHIAKDVSPALIHILDTQKDVGRAVYKIKVGNLLDSGKASIVRLC